VIVWLIDLTIDLIIHWFILLDYRRISRISSCWWKRGQNTNTVSTSDWKVAKSVDQS